jgi:hypothetical protein
MGKWSKFKDTLRQYVPEGDWQSKVDEVKLTFQGMDHVYLAKELLVQRHKKREAEAEVKAANVKIEACQQLLIDYMEAGEVEQIRLTDGPVLSIKMEPYCSVKDKPKLNDWVKRSKLTNLFQLNWQTLNGMVKELLIEGKKVPPGVEVFMKKSLGVYGGKHVEDEE